MSAVMVRYTAKPDAAARNEELVRARRIVAFTRLREVGSYAGGA